jgi:hypothetical protein
MQKTNLDNSTIKFYSRGNLGGSVFPSGMTAVRGQCQASSWWWELTDEAGRRGGGDWVRRGGGSSRWRCSGEPRWPASSPIAPGRRGGG